MYSYKEVFEDNNIVVAGFSDRHTDRHGAAHVTLTSGGVKGQGEQIPVLFASPEKAAKQFEEALLVWLNGRRTVILRMAPEMREVKYVMDHLHKEVDTYTYFYVACRLTAI